MSLILGILYISELTAVYCKNKLLTNIKSKLGL